MAQHTGKGAHLVKGIEHRVLESRARVEQTVDEAKCNVFALGRGVVFTSPYIGKTGPYDTPMSICTKVMSKGVHNIAFSVTPDV
jgi:hypothetical protein